MQLCRECGYLYPSNHRILCLCCDSTRLTIPTAENLVGIVTRLLDRGIEVVSASCDIHDVFDCDTGNVSKGKTVKIQIELGYLYHQLFSSLPPDWLTYEYHTVYNHKIGPKYTGLSHSQDFINSEDDEIEFATALTISNLELWLDNYSKDGLKAVLKLAGY